MVIGMVPRFAALAVIAGIGLASSALGQNVVEFGIYAPGTGSLAGIYTDPYQGYYNGNQASLNLGDGSGNSSNAQKTFWNQPSAGGTSTQVGAFCDDFTNDVNPPQYWTALDTNLSAFTAAGSTVNSVYYTSGTSGSAYTGLSGVSGETFSQTEDYIALAYLAYKSTQQGILLNQTAQEQYSYAVWEIFDPGLLGTNCNPDGGCLSNTDLNAAQGDAAGALNWAKNFVASNANAGTAFNSTYGVVNIFSAETNGVVEPVSDNTRPQEFLTISAPSGQGTPLPEPSSLASLGLDLAGAGIMALVFGRRRLRNR